MKFFITNSLPEFIGLISSATPFTRRALAKDEERKPLIMPELDALREFKQAALIMRLRYKKAA